MQSIVITTGLLVLTICVDRLLKYKQEYGADEITWKRLKEYLRNTYDWLVIGSIVGMLLIVIGLNWDALIQIFLS